MPIQIQVVTPTDQSGQVLANAQAAILAEAPDALIEVTYEYNPVVTVGKVISQVTTNVAIEAEGGPAGSKGMLVALLVSAIFSGSGGHSQRGIPMLLSTRR